MVSIAEVYAHLSIECPSGFLQAEVVVQLLVRKVPALEREVVASVTETVGKAQVVGELARNHVVALVRTDFGRIISKAVQVLVVVSIIRKSKFPQNPKRSVRFSGKGTKRSVQKRKARNTQKAETKVL